MKTTRTLTVGDKRYEAYLTIKDMRMVEREINQSLLSIFDASSLAVISRMTANLGIDLVMAVLRFAIHDEKQGQRSDDELYDLIDEYCSIEGQTMDDLGGFVIQLIFDTGLYNKVKFHPGTEKKRQTDDIEDGTIVVGSIEAWIENAEPVAYGMLSLKPREFEELQIQEFNAMVQGHLRQKRKQDEMQAYFTYWQLLPQLGGKTSITPADILAPLYPDVKPDPKEEREELLKVFGM